MKAEEIVGKIVNADSRLLVFDRDGTIVPYADHPDDAIMDQSLKETLIGLANCSNTKVAILSARSIKDLERDFSNGDPSPIILAGNYGLELRLADGSEIVEEKALCAIEELQSIRDGLLELANPYYGGILEDHRLSICLHWHKVAANKMDQFRAIVNGVKEDCKNVRFGVYPTSFEFFPDIDWTKGNGLELILSKSAEEAGCASDPFILFCGDTDSDEPAMKVANARGGISVRVGTDIKSTVAKCKFERPAQVGELLSQILNCY